MAVKKFSAAIILSFVFIFFQVALGQPKVVQATEGPVPPVENTESTIKINKVLPDKSTTKYVGTSLVFSVEAEGTDLQYKWTIYKESTEVYASDTYSSSNTIEWIPTVPGVYKAKVSIKNATEEITSDFSSTYNILVKPQIKKIYPDSLTTQYLGTSLKFSVDVEGDNLQYQWILYKSTTKGTTIVHTSAYSKSNAFSWTPKTIDDLGSYKAKVRIKNGIEEITSNFSSEYKVLAKPNSTKITELKPSMSTTIYTGKKLNFSVKASGTGLQYKWIIYKDSKPVYTSPYSSKNNIFSWTVKDEGVYKAKVHIINQYKQVLVSGFTKDYKAIVDVNALVKPYIVIATVNKTTTIYSSASSYSRKVTTFKKGDKVEIIKDTKGWYHVKKVNTKTTGWVKGSSLSIPKDTLPSRSYMKKEHLERYVNENKFESKTKYLIWVDLYRQRVNVFTGKKGSWKLLKTMDCASGRNTSPTVRGSFTVTWRGPKLYSNDVIAKYKTNFYGAYYFHSTLYSRYNESRVIDSRLGQRLSHGCIRLATTNALWIYNNIGNGTKVFIN
jgi:SH3-like domain-containing protein